MTDLTVLVSPIPVYPGTKDFTFGRRSLRPLTPIMVTLEREIDGEADEEASKTKPLVNDMDFINPPASPQRRSRTPSIVDSNLLSPPAHTWRSRPRHRPTRSQSAPPERRVLLPAVCHEDQSSELNNLEGNSSTFTLGRALKRSSTPTLLSRPITRGGELVRPPPPLFRPTTFWRKTRRSGVTGASYSPASHLIRRSTYIAAGLAFDAPIHDLSALCVESRVMVALALETVRSSHVGYDDIHVPRQISLATPVLTTPIGYSSAAEPIGSNPPIVIPFLPSSTTTTPPSSTFLSTSTLFLSSSQHTSNPTSSLSSSASPTPSAQNTTAPSPFKFIYLIPAVALVGILLSGLIGWVLYGCMTRKPRVHGDDGALLVGPRYIGISEPDRYHAQGHNIERREEPTQMKSLPGAIRASSHFCWPPFDEKPAFDPVQGFYIPDEYLHADPFSALPLATRPNTSANTRTKSTRTTHTSKSLRTLKSTRSTAGGPSRNVLTSPTSDSISLALLELYESDEEEETQRKAQEVPWESLRHKSIKRGILEQVKKEGKWMDSIRGLAGSSLVGSHPETIIEEGNVLLGGLDADESMEVGNYVGRRQRYSVPDSDPFADSPTRTLSILPKKRPLASSRRTDSTTTTFPRDVGFQMIPESAATTPNHSPRRNLTWLKKDGASNALETPARIPTPIPEARWRNQGENSQSSGSISPVKRTSTNGLDISQVPRRDILPQSPAQIMSPPLQSQICFTPIPASSARVHPQSPREYHLKSRVSVSLSPTKPLMISSASKGKRKVQSPRNLHRLPKPPSFQAEVSPGQTLQRPDSGTTNDIKDPIKKVEQIMASSWSTRDLGQGGMRNLSPTGFGRRV